LIASAEVLGASIVAWRAAAIVARRIFLRGVVLVTEILWSRSVRFGLALFGFAVHVRMRRGIGVVMFFDGGVFCAWNMRVVFVVLLVHMMFMRIVFMMLVVLM
jgi:hypothetical protein